MASPANRRRPAPSCSSSTTIEMNASTHGINAGKTSGENADENPVASSLTERAKSGTAHAGENDGDADASPLENDSGMLMHENARTIDSFLESAYHRNVYMHPESLHAREPSILSDVCDRNKFAYHLIILSLGLANASDASEILCLSYLLSNSNFQDDILKSNGGNFESGLIAASVFIGMLSGGLVVGAIADTLGRRPTLLFGLVLNAVAGMLSALSTNAYNLAAIRLIAGVGIGASIPPLFSLVSEMAPPSRRGLCVNVVASFWMVGSIYVALVAILSFQTNDWSWRVFAILCAIPSLAGAVAVWMVVPASPRFLAKIGMIEEATEIANTLAIKMGANTMPVGATYNCESESGGYFGEFRLLQVDEVAQQYPQSQSQANSRFGGGRNFDIKSALADGIKSTKDLYSPNLRKGVTMPLQLIWFTLSFGSYGLLTWINSIFVEVNLSNVYFNALLFAAANLPGNIIAGALLDRIGRRRLLTIAMGCSALSLVIFAHYSQVRPNVEVPNANTMMIVLSACSFQAFSITAWNAIDCITGEEFPTSVRSTGLGICTASGRIGALVAQFVNSWLIDEPARLLLVASATLLFGAASPILLEGQDMAGRNLEDNPSEHHRNTVIRERQQHASAESHDQRPVGYDSLHSAASRRSSRPPVFLTLLGLMGLLLPETASGLALPPPGPRPDCYKSAEDIPSPPIDASPFQPSPLDDAFVAAFRWTLQRQSGQISKIPGFDGMMQELIDFRVEHGPDELERVSYQTMVALAGPVPFIYRHLFAGLEATPAILSWFAKWLLPFLVGDMTLTSRGEDDPRGGGVLVHRCRVLEGSGCKGVCSKMCKVPTQRFFAEQWGVPLEMSPDFATGECHLVFGKEPLPIEKDPTIPPGCLSRCPAAAIMEDTIVDKC